MGRGNTDSQLSDLQLAAMPKPPLTILLAAPRGFCAGVVRAIDIVERALALYGAPVYVRHEIVHNKYVVDDLKAKGAMFVDELDEIPPGDRPVVFSAHGVPKAVPAAATARQLFQIDATCPLVTKVHMEAQRHHAQGFDIILIGHQRPPGGDRHHGAIARGRDHPDRDRWRCRGAGRRDPGEARLCHPDHPVGRRHART